MYFSEIEMDVLQCEKHKLCTQNNKSDMLEMQGDFWAVDAQFLNCNVSQVARGIGYRLGGRYQGLNLLSPTCILKTFIQSALNAENTVNLAKPYRGDFMLCLSESELDCHDEKKSWLNWLITYNT